MVQDLGDDEFASTFKADLEAHELSRALFMMRNRAGLTQTALAEKMGWQQNKISRIESTPDADLKMGEVNAIVGALGT
ncbi:helix-turn-helix domain-containing protein, partial [candidate division KSB1 bacterium]|nr:helix-turn-helix domain-containing protein [candidate division KSB1 bacterium]